MPITENGLEYTIPDEIKQLIDKEFLVQFREELYYIYNLSLEDFDIDSVFFYTGTAGWNTAFGLACIKTNKQEIYNYYRHLPWYDSDMFDGDIEDLMVENHIIFGGSIDDLITKELHLGQSEFGMCCYCGKRFLIKHMTTDNEAESYMCNKCKADIEHKGDPDYHPNANEYYKSGIKLVDDVFKK